MLRIYCNTGMLLLIIKMRILGCISVMCAQCTAVELATPNGSSIGVLFRAFLTLVVAETRRVYCAAVITVLGT